jgi:hypothetical protein
MTETNVNEVTEQELSNEELGALLKEAGLDIRQLAMEARALKKLKEETKEKEDVPKKEKKENPFELTLVNYPDFAITKKTPRTTVLLVIMPSCDGYFIKTTKNGEESTEELTRENYAKFSSGMEPIKMPEDFWLNEVKPGVGFYDALKALTEKKPVVDAIKNHCFPKKLFGSTESYWEQPLKEFIEMYENIPVLVKEFSMKYPDMVFWKVKNAYLFLQKMQKVFGLENTRDFIESIQESLVDFKSPSGYKANAFTMETSVEELFGVPMKYDSFKEYVLYAAYSMGYGDDISKFLNELTDTWSLQKDLYGKIKDK